MENILKKDCQFRIICYILINIKHNCYNTDLKQNKEDEKWIATNVMEMEKMIAHIVRGKVIRTRETFVLHAKDMGALVAIHAVGQG